MSKFLTLRTKYDNSVSRAIHRAGFSSISEFARKHNLKQQSVQKWIGQGYVPKSNRTLFCTATGAKPEDVRKPARLIPAD